MDNIKNYINNIENKHELEILKKDYMSQIFKNDNDRQYFNIKINSNDKSENDFFKILISNLIELNYQTDDYKYAYKADSPDKKIKITKLFKNNQKFLDEYSAAMFTKSDDYKIVISKNIEDIVSMSTNRSWTSCMNMEGGCNKHLIYYDLKYGSLIAYIINREDLEIKNPVGRLLIKPLAEDNKFYLDKLYTSHNLDEDSIKNELTNILTKKNLSIIGIDELYNYRNHKELYTDVYTDYTGLLSSFDWHQDILDNKYKNTKDFRKYIYEAINKINDNDIFNSLIPQHKMRNVDGYELEESYFEFLDGLIKNYNEKNFYEKNLKEFKYLFNDLIDDDDSEIFLTTLIKEINHNFKNDFKDIYEFDTDIEIKENELYIHKNFKIKSSNKNIKKESKVLDSIEPELS